MTGITSDPNDPRIVRGSADTERVPQHDVYLVLDADERAKGYIRPLRHSYIHDVCGSVTTMGTAIAQTYARNPSFYGSTYCVRCAQHRPVGADGEFTWDDGSGQKVGT